METTRVDIVYRPLRIGFVVMSGDLSSFRRAVRLCTALWGGRFNPIIPVDRPEAPQLVEVFRPDFLVPLGDNPAIATFIGRYPHLPNPLFGDDLFYPPSHGREGGARVLDIQNLLSHWREKPDFKRLLEDGVRFPRWDEGDALADAMLAFFGGYPDKDELGIDYAEIFAAATTAIDVAVERDAALPAELLKHPTPMFFSRLALTPHYRSRNGWNYPGVYVGDAGSGIDLINFWNLRSCGTSLLFVDLVSPHRTADLVAAHLDRLRGELSGRDEFRRKPAVWSQQETAEAARAVVGGPDFIACTLSDGSWNGLNVRPQLMHLGSEVALGVMGEGRGRPNVRFALKEKPFSGSVWFHQQHLVASISLIGGRTDGMNHTFAPPYVPELNEVVARAMHYGHNSLRLEGETVGIVIDAADHDIDLTSMSVPDLIERALGLAGFTAKVSGSGLITRQLITRMGGVGGGRAFKIPGVRKLLKTHGPTASFTKKGALQLIGQTDAATGDKFQEHRHLFIEPRDHRADLTPQMVFGHLVAKGLFRIGVDLTCPVCQLTSWTPLDTVSQKSKCALCGSDFDATRQLIDSEYAYRRSGVLGLEKNTQGAIPVVLLLQQLSVNLAGLSNEGLFGVSYDLVPTNNGSGLPTCETDFCILLPEPHSDKTTVLIGECKDVGGTIDENDIEHLRQVADAFPANRFDVYVLLAKLAPFSEAEVALGKSLNNKPWTRRVIMLTARELDPYYMFERTNLQLGLKLRSGSADDLANATDEIYFQQQPTLAAPTGAEPGAPA